MKIEYNEENGQIKVDIDDMQDIYITIDNQTITNIELFFKRLIALKSIKIFEEDLTYSEELADYLEELPVEFKLTFNNLVQILNDFTLEDE